jgi:hypothetical protein
MQAIIMNDTIIDNRVVETRKKKSVQLNFPEIKISLNINIVVPNNNTYKKIEELKKKIIFKQKPWETSLSNILISKKITII